MSRIAAFLRKWWRWIAITAGVVAAYPALTTLALASGLVEWLISGDDVRVEIENPAWTVWPGALHVKRIGVYVNGKTQVTLSVADARVDVVLSELFQKRFHVSSLSANDIRFRVRTRVPESRKNAPYVAAFPPMPELPGDTGIVRDESKEKKDEEQDKNDKKWTVRIDDIDANIRELWFMQYRYLGGGRVRGGFMKGPERFYVDNSVQELSPGALTFGEKHVISKNFRGRVQGHIPEIDPSDRGVLGIFEVVDADIRLDGDLESLAHLGDYLDGMRVEGGAGPLKIRLGMRAGKLDPATEVAFATEDVRVLGDGYGIKSDCELAAFIGDAPSGAAAGKQGELPRLRSRAKLTTLSWARGKSSPFTLQLHDHEQTAALSATQIDRQTTLGDYRLRFPSITSTDLDDLDNLLGPKRRVDSERGTLRGSLTLELSKRGSLQGPARLRFDGASVGFLGLALRSDGHLQGYLDVDFKARAAALGKLSAELRRVSLRAGDVRVNDWWMRLESPLVSAVGWPPQRLTADLSIVAKNAEPILQALAQKDELPDVVADLISLDNLTVQARFRKRPGVIDIVLDDVQSDVLDLTGRVHVGEKQSHLALVVGGKRVSLGIFRNGGDTELEAQAGGEWLERKLRTFPPLSDGARPRTH